MSSDSEIDSLSEASSNHEEVESEEDVEVYSQVCIYTVFKTNLAAAGDENPREVDEEG